MVIAFDPLRLRTLGRFSAGNPWKGGQPTEYSIEEYVMMPAGSARAVENSQFARVVGIRSESDGVERWLPESFVELWRRGLLSPESLPSLLQEIEPRISDADCHLTLHQSWQKTIGIPLLVVLVVVTALGAVIPLDGSRMPLGGAFAMGAGFTALTGGVLWIVRRTNRARREEQMKWALSRVADRHAASGNHAKLDGTYKTLFVLWAKLFATFVVLMVLGLGGAALWYWRGGGITPPAAAATTRDIQLPLKLTSREAAHGKQVSLEIPERGETIKVRVPAGVHDGTRLRLRGEGVRGANGGPSGDLYITIRVE